MNIQEMVLLLQSKGNLTQLEIASSIDCSQSNISAISHGKRALRPSSKTVDGLRRLLAEKGLTAEMSKNEKQDQKEPQ
jgi:transcriptional regulator with XRE-family HTH domain